LNFGIDFKGGTEIVLQFEKPVDIAEIRGYVENIGLGAVELKHSAVKPVCLCGLNFRIFRRMCFPR
jgi:preprotein translocase subunit SecF